MKAQSHLWLWQFRSYLRYGMLSSCICSTLLSVCAMKGIPIGPLAYWGKYLTYYHTPFFCLVNWDMHFPGSACRGTDLPSGRLLYMHACIWSIAVKQAVACAPVTQLARVRSPAGTRVLGEVFSGFFLNFKTIVRRLLAHKVPDYHLAVNHPFIFALLEWMNGVYRVSCSCCLGGGPNNELIPHSGRHSMSWCG